MQQTILKTFRQSYGKTLWINMSHSTRKPTLLTLRNVSTRISLSIPRRLTRIDTFCLLWIFCFRNHYSLPLLLWDGMCRSGLACADCAGWSGSIHYAESIMLVLSWNGSYILLKRVENIVATEEISHYENVLQFAIILWCRPSYKWF